ncbi:MAG: ATP-grasp domain-containing protein [Planctomycetota bacterium]
MFVRPDSPLKPFSGRVLEVADVSLAKLDHGFYFDDESLPIVVCPIRDVGREWRFVVFHASVVAGSAYDAGTRSATADQPASDAWDFAQTVASTIPAPADAYILDVCESEGDLCLLELNPFGGADLYACDARSIVRALAGAASDS